MKAAFSVAGQRLIRRDRTSFTHGSRGINTLAFTFDDEWNDLTIKVCGFKTDGEWDYFPIRDNAVVIPDDYCDQSFQICLVGQDVAGRRQTTNAVGVEVK